MTDEVRKGLTAVLATYLAQAREVLHMLGSPGGDEDRNGHLLDNAGDEILSAQGYVEAYRPRLAR